MTLIFHGILPTLLRRNFKGQDTLNLPLHRHASIKDVVESCGIPHTEVGRLRLNGKEVSFSHIVQGECRIEVYPHNPPVDVLTASLLRPLPLKRIAFSVDVNVARLAGLLRMAGFDTFYKNYIEDSDLAEVSACEGRILLTKDMGILRRKRVVFGHLVKEIHPEKQLKEVISFYGIAPLVRPFSRCLRCNGHLLPIAKEDVLDQLEPLTKKFYNSFCRCSKCHAVYWPGSHRNSMTNTIHNCLS